MVVSTDVYVSMGVGGNKVLEYLEIGDHVRLRDIHDVFAEGVS